MEKYQHNTQNNDFDMVTLKLASPSRILEWSHGEVTKPETINYRTQRAEKSGLFDEKIFGPEKDYECYCGKYKGIRYKNIVCDRCGVEVTRSIVRRERMGHIELATPVSHIWFLRGIPSRISLILGISAADVEKVVYFAGYIVTKVHAGERTRVFKELDTEYKTKLKQAKDSKTKKKLKEMLTATKQEIESIETYQVLQEATYHRFSIKYSSLFEASIGAEAIYDIFKGIDLKKLIIELEEKLKKVGAIERARINKRLSLMRSMNRSGVRSEWMFLTTIPVIPPALRPMVALEGGRHATSDLNDLYRRVINRNNRLKKLLDINAPDVILRNEKRILQEAVDALLDNSIRHGNTTFSAMSQSQRRPLKSLSDYLKSKQGYFRQNLLGKRVDYSGRSVIVIGPDLDLDECGLPKHMALELFRPFVIAKLLEKELAYNIRGAGRLIEDGIPEVWAILEDVIKDKHVLLNRAPTLHRQGIQAFRPILIEGDAIQIHPLVCPAYNADFDGDQMAVHVPLSEEAQFEARSIMSANMNILKPGNGEVVTTARHDIILGCYWMTKIIAGEKGEGKIFPSPNAVITAYDFDEVGFRAKIKVMPTESLKYKGFKGEVFKSSAGRLLFNSILPSDYPFINHEMNKKNMEMLINNLLHRYGLPRMPAILNKIKDFGFQYAMHAGITWGLDDVVVPKEKTEVIEKARVVSEKVKKQFDEGLLSEEERLRMNIEIWHGAKKDIEKHVKNAMDPDGSVSDMINSGARGSLSQVVNMVGMKGLIAEVSGDIIEFPIITSMKEGLSPIEYFITTHGARKGLADTALNTATAGYLTRRLFDVAQDAIITEEDCGTKEGVEVKRKSASGIEISFARNIVGRVLAVEVKDGAGKKLFAKGHLLSSEDALRVEESGLETVTVRSPMTCNTLDGVCRQCYGADLTTNELVWLGEAIGTIAAQAIGEPGTQLTMRTFHAGGTASVGGDITQGLPRVSEIFERRSPKNAAVISHVAGMVTDLKDIEDGEKILTILSDQSEKSGSKKDNSIQYTVNFRRMSLVKVGEQIERGQLLTDGSADLIELFEYAGRNKTQDYIINEIVKIYELQGASISRKHIEIIIKQMFGRQRIKDPGDSEFTAGDTVENRELVRVNKELKEEGKKPVVADALILGITEVSLTRKSFLSAASFQYTTKVLINAAIRGSEDNLLGLKENVIIGRLIPAGTGFPGSPKAKNIADFKEKQQEGNISGEGVT